MLTLSEVSKSFGGRILFTEVSLEVNRGDRVGVVGANGAGKTSLLSLILQREAPDQGAITLQRNVSVGFLPQESAPVGEETVLDLAAGVTPEAEQLRRRIKAFDAGDD